MRTDDRRGPRCGRILPSANDAERKSDDIQTIKDVYAYFSDLFGADVPVGDVDRVRDWLHTNRPGRYEDLTDDDIGDAWDAATAEAWGHTPR